MSDNPVNPAMPATPATPQPATDPDPATEAPAPSHPAAWYPDPLGRYDHRWFDGSQWTAQVATGGGQTVDPEGTRPTSSPTTRSTPQTVASQVARVGSEGHMGTGTLMTEPILVVNQKAQLFELNNEYAVYDQHGTQIGAVRQVGQSTARKVLRAFTQVDQYLTTHLDITDTSGKVLMRLTRPAKILKSTVIVKDAADVEIGRIVQRNAIGKIRFGLEVNGAEIGSINAQNWRAWDFSIKDADDQEVAVVKKTWAGLIKASFTAADHYVVRIHRPLGQPLHQMVVAAALAVDTALKQDAR